MAASDPSVPPPPDPPGGRRDVPVAGWAERPLTPRLLLPPTAAAQRSSPCSASTTASRVPPEVIGVGRWGTGTVRRLSSRRYQTRLTLPTGRVALGSFATPREATTAISRANSVGLPASRPDRTSMEAWVERWWATRIGHRATTQVRDRAILDHRILPVLGDVLLAEITTALVQEWVNDLARRLAPSTVRRTYTVLAQLLDAAVDAGLLAAAPTSRIRLPRRERYEARFLTADELEHLAEVIREPWRSMVLALAYATLRIGEVAGLRRIDVDPAAGTLRVANNLVQVHSKLIEGPPKTAAGRRTMTMPPTVMDEIGEHLARFAGPTHVFCSPQGGLLRPDTWRNLVWRPAVRKAGLAPLRVHDLKVRHEAPCTGWDERTHLRPVAAGRSKLRAA